MHPAWACWHCSASPAPSANSTGHTEQSLAASLAPSHKGRTAMPSHLPDSFIVQFLDLGAIFSLCWNIHELLVYYMPITVLILCSVRSAISQCLFFKTVTQALHWRQCLWAVVSANPALSSPQAVHATVRNSSQLHPVLLGSSSGNTSPISISADQG